MLRKIIITIFFLHVNLEKSPLVGILKLKDNLFHSVNKAVHEIINKLFITIKLNDNFTESSNIKMLLIMHGDLNNIAEKNCKIYADTQENVKINYSLKLNIIEVLNEVINELSNNHIDKVLAKNSPETEVKSRSLKSLDVFNGFFNKINKLTVNEFIDKELNEGKSNNEKEILSFRRRTKASNLKVWHPPSSREKEQLEYKQTRRIYKGKSIRIKKYSFMVSIHLGKQFLCAGSIVSVDLVITSASCLQLIYNNQNLRKNPSSMHIRFGSDYTKMLGNSAPIAEFYFHPLYNPNTLKNNLALIRISSQVGYSTRKRKVRRIVYDREMTELSGVEVITVLGWGATDHVLEPNPSQSLAMDQIQIYNFTKCQHIYSKLYVSEENFCVGVVGKGAGACDGDVGGPGLLDGLLLGVISFGSPVCGDPNTPTVFTKLGYYSKWIDSFVNKNPSVNLNKQSFLQQKPKSLRTKTKPKYPEEVMILNQILNDVLLSNLSFIDEFLYGDLENDYEIFNHSTTHDPLQHPLVNRSIFLHPHIHDFGNYGHTEPVILTTSSPLGVTKPHPGFNIDYIHNQERIKDLEHAYPWLTTQYEEVTTARTEVTTTTHFIDMFTRSGSKDEFFDIFREESNSVIETETSNIVSDNYEIESEGLSIDINSKQRLDLDDLL